MAASDKTIPYTNKVTALALADGAGTPLTITLTLQQGGITFTVPGAVVAEPRNRGQRPATPIALDTDQQNVTGSITVLVSSYKGNTGLTMYEWFTEGATLTTTGVGDRKLVTMTATCDDSAITGGASQVLTFAYTYFSNVRIDAAGTEGMHTLTADFTSLIDKPSVA